MFTKRKQTGIGVIFRDDTGAVVAAMSKKMAVPLGALETEVKAMEMGVRFAAEVGIRDAIAQARRRQRSKISSLVYSVKLKASERLLSRTLNGRGMSQPMY